MAASDILKLVLERRRAFEEFIPRSFWIVEFENTDSIRREILDGIWGRSPDNRPEGPFRGTHFEELLPPTTKGGRWSLDRADTGVDASDLSFWLDADALYLVERRDNGCELGAQSSQMDAELSVIGILGVSTFGTCPPTRSIALHLRRLSIFMEMIGKYGKNAK
ncbi:hypothetical protein M408DRAFT_197279 [Serendipita vermifera MAFF 305830]|uniref:Uncharacterized protein n=1 Tax=Serendipita vermifera MAFF 305830 TaxID=933852 RepID=A0A0C3B1Y6_SERVB|nr:hypothetical protein M408DRAFT_197279 [Serendipita vermifera MAFF 305830]